MIKMSDQENFQKMWNNREYPTSFEAHSFVLLVCNSIV